MGGGRKVPVEPRLAATLLLLLPTRGAATGRPTGAAASEAPFRVLFVKRAATSRFFPNRFVFPGGAVERADFDARWPALARAAQPELMPENAHGGVEKPGEQHAFRVAAIRELFEETALLLASDARPSAATPPPATRRCALRADAALHAREGRRLREDASAFWRLCEEQRVAPHSLQLLPWSRWITPEQEPKRYDTWFYLAPLDAATPPEARVDGEEAVASAWLTPAEALALARAQKLELSPPTHYVLEELRRFSSLDALLWAARARPLAPIQPRLLVEDGAAVVALPGDPAHPGGSRLRRHRLVLDTETRVWHLHDAAAPAPPQPQEQEQDAGDRPRSPAHGKPASRL